LSGAVAAAISGAVNNGVTSDGHPPAVVFGILHAGRAVARCLGRGGIRHVCSRSSERCATFRVL